MKPKLLPIPKPYYRRDYSRHPHAVRISFDDGSTAIYDRRDEQPAPVTEYYPRHRRDRT